MMKIISVHTPKAGGTSVLAALQGAFGSGLLTESNEDPADPRSPRNIDPIEYFSRQRSLPKNVSCIHGHFHPGQFDTSGLYLFTLLRHPVDNIISIYFFWKALATQGQPLHDYFLSKNLSIIEMARLPLLRYLYSQTYFGSFDMKRFSLIGRHEDRETALRQLGRETGIMLDSTIHANATVASQDREELSADTNTRNRLVAILEDDIRFYDRHCGG